MLSSADQLIEKYQTEEFLLINIACINLKSRCLQLYVHINVCGTLKKKKPNKHVPYLKPEVKPRKRRGGGTLKSGLIFKKTNHNRIQEVQIVWYSVILYLPLGQSHLIIITWLKTFLKKEVWTCSYKMSSGLTASSTFWLLRKSMCTLS